RGEINAGFRDRLRIGCGDEPGLAVAHDLERAARVVRGDDGLAGEECLVGNHAEVLVDRRVVDGEAARIEIDELVVVYPARKANLPVGAGGELLEPSAVGAFAGDHDAKAGRALCRLDEQVDALRAVETVDGEDE